MTKALFDSGFALLAALTRAWEWLYYRTLGDPVVEAVLWLALALALAMLSSRARSILLGALEVAANFLACPVSAVAALLGVLFHSERLLSWAEGNVAVGRRWPL